MAEIYGTTWTETAKDKIKTLLDALKTAMVTGYTPTYTYTYDHHVIADLDLNAVSVDIAGFRSAFTGVSAGSYVQHWIDVSCRVHTAYSDGRRQRDTNTKLLNSISNKLHANENLDDQYFITEIRVESTDTDFAESGSIGGELIATVMYLDTYTQE